MNDMQSVSPLRTVRENSEEKLPEFEFSTKLLFSILSIKYEQLVLIDRKLKYYQILTEEKLDKNRSQLKVLACKPTKNVIHKK
jgi:hypothetical protein